MRHTLDYHLHEVAGYINWLYFFHAWGFPARYGAISNIHGCEACRSNWLQSFSPEERDKASEAMALYGDAQALLGDMDTCFGTHAVVCLLGCQGGEGDDIVVWTDEGHEVRLPMLRQQTGGECVCLSDFLLPASSGKRDTIGLFATSVDAGMEHCHATDHYRHMLCQTLADRLAEATAERVHEEVRKRLWAYAPCECLSVEQMLREEYRGKRVAVGYPSLPDQSINFLLDNLLDMQSIGITLTVSGAMMPHASTSGLMVAHPKVRHFAVGRIGQDQLEDYARRRGMSIERTRQFLTSNIQHTPIPIHTHTPNDHEREGEDNTDSRQRQHQDGLAAGGRAGHGYGGHQPRGGQRAEHSRGGLLVALRGRG